jgi:NAD+ kinase
MRHHARQNINAGREPLLDKGTPCPLGLAKRGISCVDEDGAFHVLCPFWRPGPRILRPGARETPMSRTNESYARIAFVASPAPEAREARERLSAAYGDQPAETADVIVALGGDGFMLQTLHTYMNCGKPIYGMHRGTVGFLMNEYQAEGLRERLRAARLTVIHPLLMCTRDSEGRESKSHAFNEVSLFRQTYQAARLRILIDGKERLSELVADGVLISTPAGSTAYNLSAQGPIIPINAPLLALTPISPFRPRRWHGALLPHGAQVRVEVLEAEKRPVAAVADHDEVRNVLSVDVSMDHRIGTTLLFDPGHSLDERILREQFGY